MIRPTPRAIYFSLCVTAITALLVALAPGWWQVSVVVAVMVIMILLFDAFLTPFASSFNVDFELPSVIYIGSTANALITVSPRRGTPPTNVEFQFDVNDLLEPVDPVSVDMQPDQSVTFELPIQPKRRGIGRITKLWARWPSPFGLVVRLRSVPIEDEIRIVPDTQAVRAAAIEFTSRDAFFGVKIERFKGDGTEFESLREFQPGFDTHSIDWKQSARHRLLLSREYRTERNHQIVFAYDVGHLMAEPHDDAPKLDHAINAGLLVGLLAVLNDDQVGMFAFDSQVKQYLKPSPGKHAFTQMQFATSELDYSLEETNFTLALSSLQTRLQRRSLIILFTDFVDSITAELMLDGLKRLSKRHVILFTTLRDPFVSATINCPPTDATRVAQSVVTSGLRDERHIVFEKLRRMGIHTVETTKDTFGPAVLNKYMEIKTRELI